MTSSPDRPVVLQVLPSLVTGGVERGTIEIAQAVAQAGGTSLVTSAGGPLVGSVERVGGRHLSLPLHRKDPLSLWQNAARLASVIRAQQVDIVHARSRAPAWSAWLACRRTGAHFITTYHGTYNEDLPFKRQYNAVMARGEVVIAASRFIAELIVARHNVYPTRIRVIPRGVDPAVFDPGTVSGARVMRLTQDWRLPDGAPIVLLPGRLTSWKGQSVLINALGRLARRDVCAVLVGADQGRRRYADSLMRQAATLGLAERVRLVGQCDDMPAALKLADVVVHASTQAEAFGRVVIEAQAMARPVVAADLGGPVETVRHGVTGWRVQPGDPAALAAAIDSVLGMSEQERLAIGQQARASVPTVRAMQDATLDVYESVLRQAGEDETIS